MTHYFIKFKFIYSKRTYTRKFKLKLIILFNLKKLNSHMDFCLHVAFDAADAELRHELSVSAEAWNNQRIVVAPVVLANLLDVYYSVVADDGGDVDVAVAVAVADADAAAVEPLVSQKFEAGRC